MLRTPLRNSRWLISVLVLSLLASSIGLLASTTEAATDLTIGMDAVVADAQGDAVNLRDQPSYTGSILTSVPEGWLVNVQDGPFTDETDGTVWYQVLAREQSGYMLADYLRTPGSGEEVSAAAAATTTTALNLRASPSLTATVLLVIPSGAAVNTTGSVQNGFSQLTYQGTTGWSASQYLSTSSGTSATVIDGALNLRSGPGTSFAVLTVMPNGATVTITGALQNGFYPVTYNGTAGFASATYLQIGSGPTPTPTTPAGQTATVIDGALNLRAGPGTSFAVLTVMPNGATVTITGALQNGFYPVTYQGTAGFASATYLQIGSGPLPTPTPSVIDTATVIDGALNLRSGPGTTFSVLTVMPGGSQVGILGASQNGFYPVRFGGLDGWASATYLQIGSAPSPTATATATTPSTTTAWTTASLNLRSGAGTSFSVITVMPAGAQITLTGALQNNFYPVTYGSSSGWASADFITLTEPTNPTPGPGGGLLIWPVSGGSWTIIQGYNGGTHNGETYMYSMDLQLTSGADATIGQTIYAPASGTVLWTSGGLLIGMGNGYGIALFHITLASGITSGTVITQGQVIGSISGPGGTGYQVTPHVDITLWELPNGGGTPRISTPYTGQFTISGNDFPPGALEFNTWGGTVFNP